MKHWLLLFRRKREWEYVSFMVISCIFCYRRYCMMWRHLAPSPLWVSWDIVRLLTIEKQSYSCTIRYFDRPDSLWELVTWPTKISDDTLAFLFNILILLFEWEYVSFMIISCIFCYRRYCMMWRHLAPSPLWVSWDIVRLFW
jgi:hypothetical protein